MDVSHTGSPQGPDKSTGSARPSEGSSESPRSSRSHRHLRVVDARPEPPPRGFGLLRLLERPFLAVERLVSHGLPARWNPLAQSGAIANTTFLVAIVSGVLLLFWYVPSVHQAHGSLEAMRENVLAQLVRSLHRYSSDACLLFIVLHGLRYFVAGRFGGPRWLAWVTGIAALSLMWLVGWLGYWLVWDERAQQVALGSARMLDVLPIFVDPLSRSFLTDSGINSLLFFIVFFAHMLVPLLIAVALWLHITRLSRPLFITGRGMTAWVLGSLVLVSLAYPALSAAPARMLAPPDAFSMDYYYLLPLALTDRLAGGALWAVTLAAGACTFSLPWLLRRGRAEVAVVDSARCNACQTCFSDCPYGAIEMVPRSDGRRHATQARVDPDKCVGCGVCAGSCDSSAIGLPSLSANEIRHNMDAWVDAAVSSGQAPYLAFVCASSVATDLRIDPERSTCAELPGYRVWAVPCAGWVHALTVQRALRHGARGVVVVACAEGQCDFREGGTTAEERLSGAREPASATGTAAAARVRVLRYPRGELARLREAATVFREGLVSPAPRAKSGVRPASAAAVVLGFSLLTVAPSDAPYRLPARSGSELVVSFSHPGQSTEHCRKLSDAEKAKMPVHMRRDEICDRSRADVRLRVTVDGKVSYQRAHPASGLYGDMNAIGAVHVSIAAGAHRIEVALGDTHDAAEWSHRESQTLSFAKAERHVVIFDRTRGFRWF